MKLYNSETRKVEEFIPRDRNLVRLYTCGPTVYHFAHIGNLRTYIAEDVLERSLGYLGFNVLRAMNITDIGHLQNDSDTGEDKMVLSAIRENKEVLDIAKEYTEFFKRDCDELNIKWPQIVVPATDCIDEYIAIISRLLEKGFAYLSNGNVYFDTSKIKNYYRFGNQTEEDLVVGAREDVTEDVGKRNKNDFVLWFTKSKFENHALRWNSPWGTGYPGWHLECSGINLKYLGEYLDIHCGGVDNKFPHHTNEIAQTESFTGHEWCKLWFHVEHLNTTTGKMSKSNGDFLTLSKLNQMGYSPMIYRYFVLLSHYRKQLVLSTEALDTAKSAYEKLTKRIAAIKNEGAVDAAAFAKFDAQFKDAIGSDLNTSRAITTLLDVLKADINGATKIALIKSFDKVLALNLAYFIGRQTVEDNAQVDVDAKTKSKIEALIEERKQAKLNKNYARADEIRNEVAALGFDLIDTKEGTTFKKK